MYQRLIIIGASGHGKVVADAAEKTGKYHQILFLDDAELKECAGYPVAGSVSDARLYYNDSEFIVAIGNPCIREKIQERLLADEAHLATIIHPSVIIGKGVVIGSGTVLLAGSIVNADSKIGNGCILNTAASIDHDCVVEDYAHVSVGAHLAGTVKIGKRTWVGIGASVSNNLEICDDCMIGAGAVVVRTIMKKGTYVGIPAREMQVMSKFQGGVFLQTNRENKYAARRMQVA